jgi:methylthioribose-1-phosphate isomerase
MNVKVRGRVRSVRTVAFDARRNAVVLIDQHWLPHQLKFVSTADFYETAAAITNMSVRGAGAIAAVS